MRNGLILQDGSFLPADLVLFCTGACVPGMQGGRAGAGHQSQTRRAHLQASININQHAFSSCCPAGYAKSYDYLDGSARARLDLQKDGLYLYRNMLCPTLPNLAFVGCEVSTYNNILTSGLQAAWLARLLQGRVQLPPVVQMQEDIRQQQKWRRAVMPPQRTRGAALMLYMQPYHDQLLADMGEEPRRKRAAGRLNPLAECLHPYTSEDYAPLVGGAKVSSVGGGALWCAWKLLLCHGSPARFRSLAAGCALVWSRARVWLLSLA